ncbi:MAG: hypothetical protein IKY34_03730 [Ruminiclostridium sp.]|nr:hypothetical protein [Ruminiclostridium sp.]
MRKRVLALMMALVFGLGISAQAVQPRYAQISPSLGFTGTTANCSVTVRGENSTDKISITAKLYRGGTLLATWTKSGTGTVTLSQKKTVTKNYSYTLESNVTINGVKQSVPLVTKACL